MMNVTELGINDIHNKEMIAPRNQSSRLPFSLLFTVVVGGVAPCFQFGYFLSMSNISSQLVQEFFDAVGTTAGEDITKEKQRLLWSLIVSMMPLGACIGSTMGPISDRLGRKTTLWLCNLAAIVAALFMGVALFEDLVSVASPYLLMVGRFFGGFYMGAVLTVTQVYIAEVAPLKHRGTLLSARQIGISVAYLFVQVMAHPQVLGTLSHCYWFFGVGILLLSILVAVFLPFCQRSPRYLLIFAAKEDLARQVLRNLRGKTEIEDEIKEMKDERRVELAQPKFTICRLLTSSSLRRPLFLVLFLQLGQQFGGLPMTSFYSHQIFTQTGLSASAASVAVIIMFALTIPESVLVCWLMDRKGRRPMLLTGFTGTTIGLIMLTLALSLDAPIDNASLLRLKNYSAIVGLCLVKISLNAGPVIVPFFIGTELFLQGPRSTVAALGVLTNRVSNYIIAISFPHVVALFGDLSFIFNIIVCLIALLLVYFLVPETKKKTFEEISQHFREKSRNEESQTFALSSSKETIEYETTL